jgi:hypothetical protein
MEGGKNKRLLEIGKKGGKSLFEHGRGETENKGGKSSFDTKKMGKQEVT